MQMKKILFTFLLIVSAVVLVACKKDNEEEQKEETPVVNLAAETYSTVSTDNFNRDLFYMNSLEFEVADPTVIYAEHGEGAGYFYAFGTSDQIGCHGFQCWRSKDLANWEYVGVALEPDPLNTWAVNNYWAPEIMYDEELGLYFLFYNADILGQDNKRCLSVAYSANVMGPYIIPDGETNAAGVTLSATTPVIDLNGNTDKFPDGIENRDSAIDASPFIDPETGKRYLYWSWYDGRQEIFGMEMTDWFTPKYETITQVTRLNKVSMTDDTEIFDGQPALNEGPFVYYKDGTYFLTYSVYPYTHESYQVRVAVSDNPLTGFTKLPVNDGGTILKTGPNWRHVKSAGHHCFVQAADKLYMVYHTFYDRSSIAYGRALAADEVEFVKNSQGQLTMHANGPTYSLQPIPAVISGYDNVASEAQVTATGLKGGSNAAYLTDNLIKMHEDDLVTEAAFTSKSSVTFTFEKAVNLKAVMVYNSIFYDNTFIQIDSMEFEYVRDASGKTAVAKLGTVGFDYAWNAYQNREMEPGGAAIAEFDEMPVVKVTINFNNGGYDFNLNEIKLLANVKSNPTYKDSFATTYTYNNKVEINNFVNEGTVLGGNEYYDATYGWDFAHDGTEAGRYVTTDGINDSYVYFKDVETTKFYAEAYVSTYASKSFNNDLWPKLGMVVRNDKACMFFYIDAADQYTAKQVGYTQSVFNDSGNWDWESTEETKPLDITYRNTELTLDENYVKIAILRDGALFYLLMNDEVIFTTDNLRSLGDEDNAGVGFLGFNSPMIIRDYSITTDSAEVDQEFAKYSNEGVVLGSTKLHEATFGWDLSHDTEEAGRYVSTEMAGDSYMYFQDVTSTQFYAEAYVGTTAGSPINGDPYPKLGMTVQSLTGGVFFHVDGASNYTNRVVGYAQSNTGLPKSWNWDTHKVQPADIEYRNTSLDLNGKFVKLAILRNGGDFYFIVNDKLAFVDSLLGGLGANDEASIGFLGFNTPFAVKDYSITTDIAAKLKQYSGEGDVLGNTDLFKSTVWDLAHETDATGYVLTETGGDAYLYFKDVMATKFYAEAYVGTHKTTAYDFNGAPDGFPKFGLVMQSATKGLFFHVASNAGYSLKEIGHVQSVDNDPKNWDTWKTTHQVGARDDIAFANSELNLEGNFVKLAILRDGATIRLYVNDVLAYTVNNINGLGADDASAIGFLGFNTPMVVKGYSITTDSAEVDAKLASFN